MVDEGQLVGLGHTERPTRLPMPHQPAIPRIKPSRQVFLQHMQIVLKKLPQNLEFNNSRITLAPLLGERGSAARGGFGFIYFLVIDA